MSKVLVNETSLTAIGDAIRSKNGTENKYKPSEMAAAISAISANGGNGLTVTYAVTAIAASAFEGNADITSVSIPESVVSIGAAAFNGCRNISYIYFNAANMADVSAPYIFQCAGQDGDGIRAVIGNKVTRVPAYLFSGGASGVYSVKVTSVEFEEGSICTELGQGAFYYCMDLSSFKAPATLEKIESCALMNSTSDATFDFSACLQIPSLSDSYIGSGNSLLGQYPTIYVPAALYDEWIVATNWAAMADRIVAK
ncbi:MAG: leucine-rich repeat domain-containing protein [Clostridia bacterium]|nr:leucine-rich repeat domain-containing protein [Clostridia bacterium]